MEYGGERSELELRSTEAGSSDLKGLDIVKEKDSNIVCLGVGKSVFSSHKLRRVSLPR